MSNAYDTITLQYSKNGDKHTKWLYDKTWAEMRRVVDELNGKGYTVEYACYYGDRMDDSGSSPAMKG